MLTAFGEGQQPLRHVGSASRSLSGNQAEKVVFNGSPSEYFGPQSAKPGLFSVREPASAFEGSSGVVACTVLRRWNGNGGGRRQGPVSQVAGILSSGKVAGPVVGGAETEFNDAQFCVPPGSESDFSGVERGGTQFCGAVSVPAGRLCRAGRFAVRGSDVSPAAEDTFSGTQFCGAGAVLADPVCHIGGVGAGTGDTRHPPRGFAAGFGRLGRHDVLDTSGGRAAGFGRLGRHDVLGTPVGRVAGFGRLGRHDALGTAVGRVAGHPAVGRAPGMGRRAKRSQVRWEHTEAGSLDSFDDAFLSCRTESPSSRVSRVTSALHNLCPVHSSSFPAHNSHARMSDARCVVNSRGDTEDGGRSSCVYGGTKSLSTCTRTGVRRPAVEKLASPQQASSKLHVETWAGLLKNQGPMIFRDEEIIPGCAVRVACPSCPDYYPEPPGPGIVIRNMLGWSSLEKTERSGVWVFRGALQGENLFSLLDAAGDWVQKGSYHTAWAVPGYSSCSCSYAYGHGPAIGPHTRRAVLGHCLPECGGLSHP